MAKKGVLMYYDLLEQLKDFTDEQFGKVVRVMIKYDRDGIEPKIDDMQIKLAFNILKPTIDRNKKEYQDKCDKNRENINKRWNRQDTNEYDCIRTNTNYTDNDIDNDNDIDKDNNIKKEIDKEKIRLNQTHTLFKNEDKHKYGEYGWIKLTNAQYNKLCDEFSKDYIDIAIQRVDEYIQSNGNKGKYKDWNLVLRKAIRDKWSCLNNISVNKYSHEELQSFYSTLNEIEI